jgi:hypothetical protein
MRRQDSARGVGRLIALATDLDEAAARTYDRAR